MMNKPKRKKQELDVKLTVTYVPLPDADAEDRWYESLRILLNLFEKIEQDEVNKNMSLGGQHESDCHLL